MKTPDLPKIPRRPLVRSDSSKPASGDSTGQQSKKVDGTAQEKAAQETAAEDDAHEPSDAQGTRKKPKARAKAKAKSPLRTTSDAATDDSLAATSGFPQTRRQETANTNAESFEKKRRPALNLGATPPPAGQTTTPIAAAANDIASDPLSLAQLTHPNRGPSAIAVLAQKFHALARGIDAGMVHGKRLTILMAQLPIVTDADIARLWSPTGAPDRSAFLGALNALSQVAPDLELPVTGMSALEATRMNQLQETLLVGDDDSARKIAKDAYALFPKSDLTQWYAHVAAHGLSSLSEVQSISNPESDSPTSVSTLSAIVKDVAAGTIEPAALAPALQALDDGGAENAWNTREGADDLREVLTDAATVAPQVMLTPDQTVKEASLYAGVLAAQANDDTGAVKSLAVSFVAAFPKSERAAWIHDVILS